MDKYSTGSLISKKNIIYVYEEAKLKNLCEKENKKEENIESNKEEKKTRNLTMSDFFEEFKL